MNNLSSINLLIKVFSTIENPWSLEKQPSIGHSFCHLLYRFNISLILSNSKKISGSGGIRTHASEETGALNQRLRPLGHATLLLGEERKYLQKAALDILSFPTDWKLFSSGHVRGKYRKILKCCCQKWDLNPRPHTRTRNLYTTPYHGSKAVYLESGALDHSAILTELKTLVKIAQSLFSVKDRNFDKKVSRA